MEIYRKYRPTDFSDVKGQRTSVGVINGWLKNNTVPHAIMLTGPAGTGKTTQARILATKLGATEDIDYTEINVSEERGVDMVSSLVADVKYSLTGHKRVWVLDEIQGATKAAQNSLLKLLEEAPEHAYFILCSTNPEKLLPTLLTRCSQLKVSALSNKALTDILNRVIEAEGKTIPDEVIQAIITHAEGSARTALVTLEQCFTTDRPETMLQLVQEVNLSMQTKDLCNILTANTPKTWKETMQIYASITDPPESIRRAILGWLASALEKGWARKLPNRILGQMMEKFTPSLFDNQRPGLTLMLWQAYNLIYDNDR